MFRNGPPPHIRARLEAALERPDPLACVTEAIAGAGHSLSVVSLSALFVRATIGPDEIWHAVVEERRSRPGRVNWVFSD